MRTTMSNRDVPWTGMLEATKRRVDLSNNHDVFWIIDLEGNYGLYIKSNTPFESESKSINLKNITVIKRNSSQGVGELLLFLHKKEDSQIFYKICEDLIGAIDLCSADQEIIESVEIRLNKWQELLKSHGHQDMPIELQMGLFSELLFIKEHLSDHIGMEQAIVSWVGPDHDKQDFLLETSVIEIKSYRTSKGQLVNISSIQQLYSEKHPLFLASYGLTRSSDNGLSLPEIVAEVSETIYKSPKTLDLFNLKLVDYGYIPELQKDSYASFIVDNFRIFSVGENFPRVPIGLPNEIVKLNYTIDLSKCGNFEINIIEVF